MKYSLTLTVLFFLICVGKDFRQRPWWCTPSTRYARLSTWAPGMPVSVWDSLLRATTYNSSFGEQLEPYLPIGSSGAPWPLCIQDGRATARGAAGESRAVDLGKERTEGKALAARPRPTLWAPKGHVVGKLMFCTIFWLFVWSLSIKNDIVFLYLKYNWEVIHLWVFPLKPVSTIILFICVCVYVCVWSA